MRCVPGARGLLTDTLDAVDDGRLQGAKVEVERKTRVDGLHLLRAREEVPLHVPIAVPDTRLVERGASESGAGAVESFGMEELAAIDVAQGQVRKPDFAHVPDGSGFHASIDALAEEGQLESEVPAPRIAQIAGVIPPLGLKFGMREVVAWELVAVAGERGTIEFEAGQQQRTNLHGSPQWERVWRRPAMDKVPPGWWRRIRGTAPT